MRNRIQGIKLFGSILALFIVLGAVAAVSGGGRWSGFDPEVFINNDKFNVYIEWPEEDTCLIDGLVDVNFWYPSNRDSSVTEAVLEMESDATFPCDHSSNSSLIDDNGNIHVLTKTDLKEGNNSDPNQGGVLVDVKVNTSEQTTVRVYLYHNSQALDADGKPVGSPVQVCEGFSDDFVSCGPYRFGGEGNGSPYDAGDSSEKPKELSDDDEDEDDD
ncbi:MAG: hypothetical protein QF898_04630 [SAR202 cluster bacterium]|nr:hypothetical protein [SAR202 cluster bacterium]